jgi:transcriptional regulator with XRE-family HTH domain
MRGRGCRDYNEIYIIMSIITMRLQMRLRRLRKAKKWTQDDLAREARVSQPLVSQLESGKKANPSVVPLLRIAKALGVTVEELVK